MLSIEQARQIRDDADLIYSPGAVEEALRRVADRISVRLGAANPLVLSVMGGAVVFTGQLLPLLDFPLEFDTLYVSRYGAATSGGQIHWRIEPRATVADRTVLVLDDILDEGHTMAAIREKVMALGAREFYCAVFADKDLGRDKPITPDFVGLTVPNRYVFGFGMDVRGAWRNLPAIYALKDD